MCGPGRPICKKEGRIFFILWCLWDSSSSSPLISLLISSIIRHCLSKKGTTESTKIPHSSSSSSPLMRPFLSICLFISSLPRDVPRTFLVGWVGHIASGWGQGERKLRNKIKEQKSHTSIFSWVSVMNWRSEVTGKKNLWKHETRKTIMYTDYLSTSRCITMKRSREFVAHPVYFLHHK